MPTPYIMRKGVSSLNDLIDGYAGVFAAAAHVFYVDTNHASASDNNAGDDPNKPMKTITGGYGRLTTDVGDLLVVRGADTRYRESAGTLTLDKDGITLLGAGWGCEWNNNGLAGGYVCKVAAKAVRIINFQISVNDSGSGIYVGDNNDDSNAALCVIEDCFIRGDWLTATGPGAGVLRGIEIDGASMCTIRNNHIWGWGTGIDVSDGAYRTSYGAHIYDNKIVGCQNYGILWAGIGYVSLVENNVIAEFSASVTMTGISLAPTTGNITVSRNSIACSTPVADNGNLNLWVGNTVRSTYAASEDLSLAQAAHNGTVT